MERTIAKILFILAAGYLPFNFAFSETLHLSRMPHVYLSGYTGNKLLGQADILAPIYLKNDRVFYVYSQGRYGYENQSWQNNIWTASLGIGYRQAQAKTRVLGAYIFSDYTRSKTGHKLWVISPGIESLGQVWDFQLNGYIPISAMDWKTEGWADEFGDYSYIKYRGHNEYDAWFIYHEETGFGLDTEIGRNLLIIHNMLLKGYLNGYYYRMRHNNDMAGAGIRLTLQPRSYLTFSLNDSYNNYQHNIFTVGITLSLHDLFGRNSKNALENNNLQHKLFDQIERNFASIGSGSVIPTTGGPKHGNPDVIIHNPPGPEPDPYHDHNAPEKNNVWFFNGNAGLNDDNADGTYEHPYSASDFNQQVLQNINSFTHSHGMSNADLYLNQGTYRDVSGKPWDLPAGQSVWGRMGAYKGYQEPAQGDSRPLLIGSFKMESDTGLDSIKLENDYANTGMEAGIMLDRASNVKLNNVDVEVSAAGTATADGQLNAIGIKMILYPFC